MSTTPTTPAPSAGTTFWTNLKSLLPALELAGNVALLSTGAAGTEPLVASLEQSVNPAIQAIGSPSSTSSTVMLIYATIIGVLTTLKAQPGLPAETLAQIEGYITAAQAGTAGYLQAQSGFDPAAYAPVEPIA